MHPQYRRDIDGLRAIAVLAVVIFHAFPLALPGGFIGVDIFFVISGYLISTIIFTKLIANQFSFMDFYARRIRRIFPALLLVLFSCYIYGWFNLFAEDYAALGKHIAGASVFISNFVLWNESGYFDAASYTKILLHLWSLGVEEQFYIFYPLIIWGLYKRRINLLAAIILLITASFIWNIYLSGSNPTADFYSPISRCWELLFGSVFAYIHVYKLNQFQFNKNTSNLLSIAGFSLILFAIVYLNERVVFPGWWAGIPVIGACLLILAGPSALVNAKLLSNKLFVGIGLISYPLYLWHWPILSFSRIDLGKDLEFSQAVFLVALSFVLAWLTYQFVEKPLRFAAKRPRLKISMLLALMAIIGFIGFNCLQREGIKFRHQQIFKEISDYRFDKKIEQRRDTCFIQDRKYPPDPLEKYCIDTNASYKVVLWGDSQSASLYAGFRELAKKYDIAISQFTIAACGGLAPFPGDDCDANRLSLQLIKKIKPNAVFLHRSWKESDFPHLKETMKQLNALGTKVIVIGPTPHWTEDLPRIIYRYWKKNHQLPPPYYQEMLTKDVRITDESLKKLVPENNGIYYSAWDNLCNEDGCLILVPNTPNAPVAFDENHFTPAGAIFLIDKFGEIYFKDYQLKP
jgi:peptidoglycan/LPS O-acetylase OafA/YrhL